MMKRLKRRLGFTLIELMVVVAVIVILLALLVPAIAASRAKAQDAGCILNLKMFGLGLHNYHSVNDTFPIGRTGRGGRGYPSLGDPTGSINRHTWFFPVYTFMESSPLYNQVNFSLGFNDAANLTVMAVHLNFYVCPADPGGTNEIDQGLSTRRAKSNYVVNWGNTHYDQATRSDPFIGPLGKVAFGGAPFSLDIPAKLSDIDDGTSNTIFMSEVLNADAKNGVSDRRGDIHNDDPNASMFMGYSPPNSTTPDQMPIITGSPACVFPWRRNPPCNTVGPAFNAPRSTHKGGVMVLMGDGSAKLVKDSITLPIWRAMTTTSGSDENCGVDAY